MGEAEKKDGLKEQCRKKKERINFDKPVNRDGGYAYYHG